jgi:hypothetical protein
MADRPVRIPTDVRVSFDRTGMTILQIGKGRLFKGNLASADIWAKLVDRQPPASIATGMSVQYQIPVAEIERHIVDFVMQLRSLALVLDNEGAEL